MVVLEICRTTVNPNKEQSHRAGEEWATANKNHHTGKNEGTFRLSGSLAGGHDDGLAKRSHSLRYARSLSQCQKIYYRLLFITESYILWFGVHLKLPAGQLPGWISYIRPSLNKTLPICFCVFMNLVQKSFLFTAMGQAEPVKSCSGLLQNNEEVQLCNTL